ncbi:MAG: hypothetical protein GXP62_13605, partial [Oligoflexia bacterium]|nr:hypothetical protein [Oligoflexia bacterium]
MRFRTTFTSLVLMVALMLAVMLALVLNPTGALAAETANLDRQPAQPLPTI